MNRIFHTQGMEFGPEFSRSHHDASEHGPQGHGRGFGRGAGFGPGGPGFGSFGPGFGRGARGSR